MKDMSWTQAAPYKETMYHRTPSESIANNYTPTANELKMKNLIKIHQSRPHTRATSQPCILYFWSFKRVHYIVIIISLSTTVQQKYIVPVNQCEKIMY